MIEVDFNNNILSVRGHAIVQCCAPISSALTVLCLYKPEDVLKKSNLIFETDDVEGITEINFFEFTPELRYFIVICMLLSKMYPNEVSLCLTEDLKLYVTSAP